MTFLFLDELCQSRGLRSLLINSVSLDRGILNSSLDWRSNVLWSFNFELGNFEFKILNSILNWVIVFLSWPFNYAYVD